MSPIRTLARPMLAAPFVLDGVSRLRSPEAGAARLRPVLSRLALRVPQLRPAADRPVIMARVVGGVQVASGALLALGKAPRLASALIVATQGLALATEVADGAGRSTAERTTAISTRLGLTGGALLAAVDTAGRPSMAWRAKSARRRGGAAVRRELAAAKKALD